MNGKLSNAPGGDGAGRVERVEDGGDDADAGGSGGMSRALAAEEVGVHGVGEAERLVVLAVVHLGAAGLRRGGARGGVSSEGPRGPGLGEAAVPAAGGPGSGLEHGFTDGEHGLAFEAVFSRSRPARVENSNNH